MKKVLLITNIPTPYRIPLFNELAAQLALEQVELMVCFASPGYTYRRWEIHSADFRFKYHFLEEQKNNDAETTDVAFHYTGLIQVVKSYHPDVIITPGFSRASLKISLHRIFHPIKHIMWTGTVLPPSGNESLIKKMYRRLLCTRIKNYISYSAHSRDYLQSLGVKPNMVTIALNTVDLDFFVTETDRIRAATEKEKSFTLLYIGYLSPGKNVGKLLDVFDELQHQLPDMKLHIVGDGVEKKQLEERVQRSEYAGRVLFHGFRQKHELPQFMAQADLFLFQTDADVWGLVLNETMAAALPAIASDKAIAARELIRQGENGYMLDMGNKQELAALIRSLSTKPEHLRSIGLKARETILREASLKKTAASMREAIFKAK